MTISQIPNTQPLVPIIVLIRPQMGENIGAVARAMANFGLNELRLVAPRDSWPNTRAWEVSSGADYILDAAKLYADIPSALADIHTTYATTARGRDIAKRVVSPEEAVRELSTLSQWERGGVSLGEGNYSVSPHPNPLPEGEGMKGALLFGPERTGLENEDIALADAFVTIPTTPDYFSLNLAQAVVIMGYEWFKKSGQLPVASGQNEMLPATKEEWLDLFDQLEQYLDEAKYFRVAEKKEVMWNNIRNMLLRGRFSSQEISTLRGMLRVMWEGRKPRSKP